MLCDFASNATPRSDADTRTSAASSPRRMTDLGRDVLLDGSPHPVRFGGALRSSKGERVPPREGLYKTISRSHGRLNVEQIGLNERPRVGGLEALPAIEVEEGRGIRKLLLEPRDVFGINVEPEK
jgi:hypothetical protein